MDRLPALAILLAAYAALEAAWLFGMKGFYAARFAEFSRPGHQKLAIRSFPAAALTYVVLLTTFYALVLSRRFASALSAALAGFAFGLAAYGVYNLTNKATLAGYSWAMVAVDMAWGAGLFAGLAALFFAVLFPSSASGRRP